MRAVIQRVSEAEVRIHAKLHAAVSQGLLVLLGIEAADERGDVEWLARKIASLRIFNDAEGMMNLSVNEIKGQVLIISQFTLHAKTKKGTRPSFIRAAHPDHAIPLYEDFIDAMQMEINGAVRSGVFGANMKVAMVNDGPVTILIDTKNKDA
jgi:D-tyrosyl-tRNA(Tyr) deacylase